MFVSRGRFQDAQDQIKYLRERVKALETMLDERSMGVLDSVLDKQNMYRVKEERVVWEEPEPAPDPWSSLDHRLYSAWVADFSSANPQMTMEQIKQAWKQEHQDALPRDVLL